MREVKGETSFQMLGYVILDDHFHWLIKPKGADISKIMQSVKLRFTRRLGAEKPKHSWQKRFWDHVIRDENDFQRHLDYIHYNPVKHGFAAAPADYEFSSFGFYLANDKYVINWGRDSEPSQIGSLALE